MAVRQWRDPVFFQPPSDVIAVTQRCDACIGFHMRALVKLGATREEVSDTLGVCVYMGGGPAMMYAADAIAAFDEFSAH